MTKIITRLDLLGQIQPGGLYEGGLVVAMGPAGVGKTTAIRRYFPASQILSSDSLRGMVSGDEGCQEVSGLAFTILKLIRDERLKWGVTTVVDTTALNPMHRLVLLSAAHAAGRAAILVTFSGSEDLCQRRNAARQRQVPPGVVAQQSAAMREQMGLIGQEGWDAITHAESWPTDSQELVEQKQEILAVALLIAVRQRRVLALQSPAVLREKLVAERTELAEALAEFPLESGDVLSEVADLAYYAVCQEAQYCWLEAQVVWNDLAALGVDPAEAVALAVAKYRIRVDGKNKAAENAACEAVWRAACLSRHTR